jgi:hypothetical protein
MSSQAPDQNIMLALETWKKSIDVQEHFNEVCMRIRNFYITVISALLALIGVIINRADEPYFHVGFIEVHVSIPIILAIVMATILFYFVDRHWYHRLLVGAVLNALAIEKEFGGRIPGLNLTSSIGKQSPLDVSKRGCGNLSWYLMGRVFGSDERIKKDKKIHSDAKISIFYKSIFAVFNVILLMIVISGGVRWPSHPIEPAAIEQPDPAATEQPDSSVDESEGREGEEGA